MREIKEEKIIKEVAKICKEVNCNLREDVLSSFKKSLKNEKSKFGKNALWELIENAKIAREKNIPICQDTGIALFFVDLGNDVKIKGNLYNAIQEGVKQGYNNLRKSVVFHPFLRKNTSNNTPAIIHLNIVKGDKLKIIFFAKGGGSENTSSLKMLNPQEGEEGVKKFVLNVVKEKAPFACPPVIVGIGIGGTAEYASYLAKKSLLRKIGKNNHNKIIAKLERNLLKEINKLGIGPQALGGRCTAISVNIEYFPSHIANLPVAVNIGCSAHRWGEILFLTN